MKTVRTILMTLLMLILLTAAAFAQKKQNDETKNAERMKTNKMNTYVIEREIPNAGDLNAEQLQGISQTSCSVLKELGPDIQWVQSYVAGNKIYCIYKAANEQILREHAQKGGFPINSVTIVSSVISPAAATAPLSEIMN